MKVILLFITLTILFSCSKEVSINNRLEGNWYLLSMDGQNSLYNNISSRKYIFIKTGKKNGFVRIETESYFFDNYNLQGEYTIENKELKMKLNDDYGVPLSLSFTVKFLKQDKLKFVTIDGLYESILLREKK